MKDTLHVLCKIRHNTLILEYNMYIINEKKCFTISKPLMKELSQVEQGVKPEVELSWA